MDQNEAIINTFLENVPLVPLPRDFTARVMRRVVIEKHFKLRFADFMLPAFLIFFLPVLLVTVWWGIQQIDPLWIDQMQLQFQFRWMILPEPARWLVYAAPFVGAMLAMLFLFGLFVVFFLRPQRIFQRSPE